MPPRIDPEVEKLGPEMKKMAAPVRLFERKCLRCDRRFRTRHRFVRLCDGCCKQVTFLNSTGVDDW